MADPVALQIMRAMRDRLYAINPGAGYNTAPCVILGLRAATPAELNSGPVVFLYELGDEPAEDQNFSLQQVVTLSIVIEGMIRQGTDDTSTALALLWQDISRAVFLADTTLGGLSLSVLRGGRTFEYPPAGGDTVAVRQVITVQYLETYGNP